MQPQLPGCPPDDDEGWHQILAAHLQVLAGARSLEAMISTLALLLIYVVVASAVLPIVWLSRLIRSSLWPK